METISLNDALNGMTVIAQLTSYNTKMRIATFDLPITVKEGRWIIEARDGPMVVDVPPPLQHVGHDGDDMIIVVNTNSRTYHIHNRTTQYVSVPITIERD